MTQKTILITGTSSGIGKACAKLFHENNWNVIATMRAPEKETELTTLDNVFVTKLDVQNRETIDQAVNDGVERFGTIDTLLNCAGYGAYGVLEAASHETIRRQFEVNVFGLLDVTQAVIPLMRKQKSGMIINISSMVGKITFALGTLYHGSKFAVEGVSEALSYELAELGIKMKIIEPGAVKSNFGNSIDFYADPSISEYKNLLDIIQSYAADARSRGISPDIVAETVFRAATDNTSQMRYPVGPDAERLIKLRKELNDDDFFKLMRERLGL